MRPIRLRAALAIAVLLAAASAGTPARAGLHARFEVLSPTLIRAEYAQDARFEDRPTQVAVRAPLARVPYTVSRSDGWLTISTARVSLSYHVGSGPFGRGNLRLTLKLAGRRATVQPVPGDAQGTLGGWRRALDGLDAPVALNAGILSRAGWYVVDDSQTAILTSGGASFTSRPANSGPHQDWYVFGYGHDYTQALHDLRTLTGPAPLPPRTAFGVWFSRYYPYSEQDYHDLFAQFRQAGVPLDTLSVDTDFKRESNAAGAALAGSVAGAPGKPYSWDGWEWSSDLFPDPARFVGWAHAQGVSIALNIHPSISSNDPKFAQAQQQSGGAIQYSNGLCRVLIADPTGQCGVFDWTQPRQLAAYFDLHKDFTAAGADLYWLDWCCDDSSASAPGLTPDTWINSRYAALERSRGLRWPAFSRAGAYYLGSAANDGDGLVAGNGILAEHRYTMQFTGDTCATWEMLGFEAEFTAAEGSSVGLPYVTHDIGSFNGQPQAGQCSAESGVVSEHLPDDLYARWVAFGTFQPLDRLHSNHGDRLPWQYGGAADAAATSFLRLREQLIPYTYSLARRAYDTGLPLTGAPYLQWPSQPAAYTNAHEYTFGPDLVVAPVITGGDPAPTSVWIPPRTWYDYFTGRRFRGPATVKLLVGLDRMPVLVRAGAVIPTEPPLASTPATPQRNLIITAYPGGSGGFALYDDAGLGFGYQQGHYTFTRIVHLESLRRHIVLIEPVAQQRYPGEPLTRSWTVRFPGVRRPQQVLVDGRAAGRRGWSYDTSTRTLSVRTGLSRTDRLVVISAR